MTKHLRFTRAAAVLLCAVLVVGLTAVLAFANMPVWSGADLEEEYEFGQVLAVPERTVSVGGSSVKAAHTVIYPDGSSTLSGQVALNISGLYTVSYQAVVDGKPYADELSFRVADYLYSFDSDKSGAAYDAQKGLVVELAEGDTMHFNAVLDLRSISMADILVEAVAMPAEQGRLDFQRLYFTFTDVEDPDNYLTFSARHSASTDDSPYTYAMVGGNGQLLTGTENFRGELKKHVEGTSNFGTPFPHSFKDSSAGVISLRFDAQSLTAYTGAQVIARLDDPEHFSDVWSGFTSGRVRLSVTAGMYEASVARFCIKSVHGVDLSTGKLEDKDGPEIQIDNPYTGTMPAAVKGGSYPVFSATARDNNTGACDVKVSVWYNYTSANTVLVDIVDGRFETAYTGDYAIVYEASDRMGNLSREVLWVRSHETVEKPSVELLVQPQKELTLGALLLPVEYQATSHSGNAQVRITATLDGEEYEVPAAGYRPEKAGTYTVTYTATDHIGQTGSISYELTAEAGEKPVFVDRPVLPAVLVDGCAYRLPELYANDYRSGALERKLASAEITDAEGTRAVGADGTFTAKVKNNKDTVTVRYFYDGARLELQVPVIQAWRVDGNSSRPKLNLDNYLYSAENALSYTKTEASITVQTGTADGAFLFANRLIAEKLQFSLAGIPGKSQFDALAITLTDVGNPQIAVTATLYNLGTSNAQLKLCGVQNAVTGAFENGDTFVLGYGDKCLRIGSSAYEIRTDDSGNAFVGFPSEHVMLKVGFVGAKQGAAYELLAVNEYAMSNLTSDRTGPKIVVLGEYGGSHSIGTKLTIPAALAADVLDPNVTFSLTVKDPQGNIVKSEEGTALDKVDPGAEYAITLDQYGQYNVQLVAADTFNARSNETALLYTINVDDEIPPEISFTSSFADTAKVGDVLVLPDFAASDNITPAQELAVIKYVYTPSGRLVLLEGASNSIVASQAGVYEFRLYVSDASGNLKLIRKAVTVE